MIYTFTEFRNYNFGNNGIYEVPLGENIISVYIQNTGGFGSFIVINGTNIGNGLSLSPGRSLRIYGRENEILNGKITVFAFSFQSIDQKKIGILIKRKI
jgi:hypothetical protein